MESEAVPDTMNFSTDIANCPQCQQPVKAWIPNEVRTMKGLTKTYSITYSVHRCACGVSFCSYPDTYPAGDTYLPEVKEYIRTLRDTKKLGYTEIRNRMKKEFNLEISINAIRTWCLERN